MNAVVSEQVLDDTTRRTMEGVLQRQQEAFVAELPVSDDTRINRINRAILLLIEHQDELCDAMREDFGHRPDAMSKFVDIVSSVNALRHARRHVRQWMRRDRRPVRFPLNLLGGRAWIEYQPLGTVGVISPWNFPVNLTFGPLASIFAAGNRAMIKPSELTPRTSALMEKLVAEYFDPTELWVVTGGPEVGKAFSGLPFDHLLFTGATEVGRHVMRAAADNLTPVTLELGGKSPAIVGEDADIDRAARRIALGKLMNAGQICLAPDYVFVPGSRLDELVERLSAVSKEMYPRTAGNDDYTTIINERHHARLRGYLQELEDRQVKTITLQAASDDGDRRMPLTLAIDPPDTLRVMRDEIFGPILPIKTYDHTDEVVDYVNARPRPLALYYFGGSEQRRRILDRTISGGVTLNDVIFHVTVDDLPFGGVGPSGMGVYHGHEGFKRFSHAKSVYRQPRINVAGLMGAIPPYGKRLDSTINRELK